jgi:hypothetical protein
MHCLHAQFTEGPPVNNTYSFLCEKSKIQYVYLDILLYQDFYDDNDIH